MSTIATLAINLIGNVSGLKSALGEAQQSIKATADTLKNVGGSLTASVSMPIIGVAAAALKGAAEMEQLEVAFTTMLKSSDKAKELMSDLSDFAAETPFEMPEVVGAGKMLLAYGVAAEDVQDTLRKLGDVAAGVGAPIGDIAYLFGTARVSGRLFTADINQFTNRGIPIISALAKTMGVAESSIKGMVEEGKVGFPDLQKALDYLTTSGGQFEGLMAAQSQTLAGLFSTLKDTVGISLSTIGRSIVEAFDLRTKLGDALTVLGTVKDAIINLAQTNPEMLKMGVIFAAVAASIGPLLVALGMVVGAVGNLMPILSALMGPMGLLVLAAVGLGLAWSTNFGGIREITMSAWATIKPALEEWIAYFQENLPGALATVQEWFATTWPAVSDGLTTAWGVIQPVLEQIQAAWSAIVALFEPSIARLQESFGGMVTGLGALGPSFTALQDSVVNLAAALMPVIETLGYAIVGALGLASVLAVNTLSAVFEALPGVIAVVVSQVTATINLIATTVEGLVQIVSSLLAGDFAGAWEGIKTVVGGINEYMMTTLGNMGTTVLLAFGLVKDVLLNTFADLAGAVGLDGVVTMIGDVDAAVTAVANNLKNFPATIATKAPEWIATLIAWIWPDFIEVPDWVTTLLDWLWPDFIEVPTWVTTLFTWAWPSFITQPTWVSTLFEWAWPDFIDEPGWTSDLFNWSWPSFPSAPDWLTNLNPFGENATGTSYWEGGRTWVGERGAELVDLPRGSQVYSNQDSMAMAAGGGGPAVVIQQAVIRDERDVYMLAYQVEDLRRRQRRR